MIEHPEYVLLIELIVVGVWLILLTISHFQESKRLTYVSNVRYGEIEQSNMITWALVDHLKISDETLSEMVHKAQIETRKTCQCDRCSVWRKDHVEHNAKADNEEFRITVK